MKPRYSSSAQGFTTSFAKGVLYSNITGARHKPEQLPSNTDLPKSCIKPVWNDHFHFYSDGAASKKPPYEQIYCKTLDL